MKLYYSDVLAPRKACAVAHYLDAPIEYIYLDLGKGEHKSPEYLALNPNGKVPTLVDAGRSLWEADAIMCHLAARSDSDLWPQDARQIEVLRWLSWCAQHFYRCVGNLYFEHIVKPRFGLGEPDREAVLQSQTEFRAIAPILDTHLEQRDWLVGDSLTVADFSMAVALPFADAAHIPLTEFPAVQRWHDRLNQLDAWREPFPARAVAA